MDREQFLALLARLFGDGEPLTAEEIASVTATAAEHATDGELADVEAACQLLGADDDTPLEVVRAAVDLVDAVRADADRRVTEATEIAAARDALRARLAGEPVAEAPEPEVEPEPEGEPEPEVVLDQEPEDEPVAEEPAS